MRDWLELHQSAVDEVLASSQEARKSLAASAPLSIRIGPAKVFGMDDEVMTPSEVLPSAGFSNTNFLLDSLKGGVDEEDRVAAQQLVGKLASGSAMLVRGSDSEELVRMLKFMEDVVAQVSTRNENVCPRIMMFANSYLRRKTRFSKNNSNDCEIPNRSFKSKTTNWTENSNFSTRN